MSVPTAFSRPTVRLLVCFNCSTVGANLPCCVLQTNTLSALTALLPVPTSLQSGTIGLSALLRLRVFGRVECKVSLRCGGNAGARRQDRGRNAHLRVVGLHADVTAIGLRYRMNFAFCADFATGAVAVDLGRLHTDIENDVEQRRRHQFFRSGRVTVFFFFFGERRACGGGRFELASEDEVKGSPTYGSSASALSPTATTRRAITRLSCGA